MKKISYGWGITILLAIMWGAVGLNRLGIAYLLPQIVPQLHLQYWEVGIILSGTSITWSLSAFLGGYAVDRVGRKRVLVPTFLLSSIITTITGLAGGFWSLFIFRDVTGIGDGVGWQAGEALISDNLPYHRWGVGQGIFSGGYTLVGAGLGAFVMTRIAVHWGWRVSFFVAGAFGLLVALALQVVLKPQRELRSTRQYPHLKAYTNVFRIRRFWFAMVLQLLSVGYLQGFIGFAALFLTRVRHLPLAEAGGLISIWGIAGFAGSFILPWLSDRLGRRVVLVSAGIVAGAVLLLLSGTRLLPAGALAASMALAGFFGYPVIPMSAATVVNEVVDGPDKAKAMGFANGVSTLVGTTVFPIVLGLVASRWGLGTTIGVVGGVILMVAPVAWAMGESRRLVRTDTNPALAK